MNELDALVDSARTQFAQAATPADLENAKAQFLGKAGRITELMKGLATLSVDEKKSQGAAINVANGLNAAGIFGGTTGAGTVTVTSTGAIVSTDGGVITNANCAATVAAWSAIWLGNAW